MGTFEINELDRLRDDCCYLKRRHQNNQTMYRYTSPSYLSWADPSRNKYFDSVQQPGVFQTGNFSGYPSHICDSSAIKNGKTGNILTHGKTKRVFDTEDYFLPPYMGNSLQDANSLARNKFGLLSHYKGTTRGITIDRFVPLLPEIRAEIQNPRHLVPEYWVHGGMDTRTVIRNIDYLKTCGLRK